MIDYRRPVRATAHTWIMCGTLGGVGVSHTFVAGRAMWGINKDVMRLIDVEIGIIQVVPDSRLEVFCEYMQVFEQRIKEKLPAKILVLANVTRSIEVTTAIWRKSPEALPIIIKPGVKCDWSFPHHVCGRALLLSRLQLWISDKKIASSLPADDSDPLIWNWDKLRNALAKITAAPHKADSDMLSNLEEQLNEDVVMGVAQLPYWVEGEIPSVYTDEQPVPPYSEPYNNV